MPKYRFYKISATGHIAGPADVVDYADDLTAIKEAQKALDGYDIEIWKGKNVVSYLISHETKKQ